MKTTQPPPPCEKTALAEFEADIRAASEYEARLANLARLILRGHEDAPPMEREKP
jgi:hypothetical protein